MNHTEICGDCGKKLEHNRIFIENTEKGVCYECVDHSQYEGNARYYECYNCGLYYDRENEEYSVVEGEIVCDTCFTSEDVTFSCSSCEVHFFYSSRSICDDCETWYCDSCYNEHRYEHDEEESGSDYGLTFDEQPYSKITLEKKPGALITSLRPVGVEIETEYRTGDDLYLNDKLPSYVGLCEDGSLENGVEIQTPPLCGMALEKTIESVCDTLNTHNFEISDRCGLHIHIDCHDIKKNHYKIRNVMLTYYYVESILHAILPSSRRTSSYCKSMQQEFSIRDTLRIPDMEQFWYRMKDKKAIAILKREKSNDRRYLGANIHSIFFRGTLEVRYHSGTTNAQKILHWIAINTQIFEYAIRRFRRKELYHIYDTEKPFELRLGTFFDLMRIPEATQNYMIERINKFSFSTPVQKKDITSYFDITCAESVA